MIGIKVRTGLARCAFLAGVLTLISEPPAVAAPPPVGPTPAELGAPSVLVRVDTRRGEADPGHGPPTVVGETETVPPDYVPFRTIEDDRAPVVEGDFPDPFVLEDSGVFYAYATNTFGANLPVMMAMPGESNRYLGDGLPSLPDWSEPGRVWAPSVAHLGGAYVLWYTTRHTVSGRQCISVAAAASPTGPFVDDSSEPFICDLGQGGSIDPSVVSDADGAPWLLWKSDGNCCDQPTVIYSQRLGVDGMSLIGGPTELIRNDLWWEGDVVEGPTMVHGKLGYQLLYSANRWDTDDYAIGHAVCESMLGPCIKDGDPWLRSRDGARGPGGPEYVTDDDGWTGVIVYHAWTDSGVGYPSGARSMFVRGKRL